MIAPEYEVEALELLMQKKNVRLLKTGAIRRPQDYGMEFRSSRVGCSYRRTTRSPRARGVHGSDQARAHERRVGAAALCVEGVQGGQVQLHPAGEGLRVDRVGAGQMSRVDSAKIAVEKAGDKVPGACARGRVHAVPGFAGGRCGGRCTAVIQPGGSIRDDEVFKVADELGIALVFTGTATSGTRPTRVDDPTRVQAQALRDLSRCGWSSRTRTPRSVRTGAIVSGLLYVALSDG